ncbi:hypothetical protein [Deinococcus aquiradiocola]|uniref:Uncharacterized protein n=1 Tax=Deinococcus aquiradiocola TaxID=393059 RepID=A0A917PGI3_9DEIO|nr:hypothetical protein [Deinococcus aquiradiocola]GGJ76601.1 hypothetical protein GCM10008939_20940 [Deinococcus aquiradiocola]
MNNGSRSARIPAPLVLISRRDGPVRKPTRAALALVTALGLAGAGHVGAETYFVTCPQTGPCTAYGSMKRLVCYCDTQSLVATPGVLSVNELRRRYPVHSGTLSRAQGGTGTLLIFSDDAALNRALDLGFSVDAVQVRQGALSLNLTFGR